MQLSLDKTSNQNPFLTGVMGDFYAKSSEFNKTTHEGSKIHPTPSHFSLEQLIKKPTNTLGNYNSCSGLIITFYPSLVMELDVHHALHSNRTHQKLFAKFNLKFDYLPPNKCEIRHCQKTSTNYIRKAIKQFAWDRPFKNLGTGHF